MPQDSPPRLQYRPSPGQPKKKDCATEVGVQPLPTLDSGDEKAQVQVGSQASRNPLALTIFSRYQPQPLHTCFAWIKSSV
jgi:hypothetical protein